MSNAGLQDIIDELRAENAKLHETIKLLCEAGDHDPTCEAWIAKDGVCGCGWDKALAATKEDGE